MRNARLLVCVAAVLAVVFLPSVSPKRVSAQADQRPTFRAGTDVVPVYVTAVDREGRPVPALSVKDFTVKDDGDTQPIEYFDTPMQPMTLALLIDRSPSLFGSVAQLQDAVTSFVRAFDPRDRATLGFFSHVVTLSPELTGDRDALLRRLGDAAPFPAGTALWDAIESGRQALAQETGRRVILVLTDGSDNCSRITFSRLRDALERDGVLLYAIGVRGREGLPSGELESAVKVSGGRYIGLKSADDAANALDSIAQELHSQYVLGFKAKRLDDKVHRLTVSTWRAGVTIRARRTYVASSHAIAR